MFYATAHATMLRHVLLDKRSRVLVGSLLIVSPIFLTTAYLHAADLWPQWWNITDLVAGVTVIAVGIAGLCLLPIPDPARGERRRLRAMLCAPHGCCSCRPFRFEADYKVVSCRANVRSGWKADANRCD